MFTINIEEMRGAFVFHVVVKGGDAKHLILDRFKHNREFKCYTVYCNHCGKPTSKGYGYVLFKLMNAGLMSRMIKPLCCLCYDRISRIKFVRI